MQLLLTRRKAKSGCKLRKLGFDKPIIGVTGATVGNEAERLLECGATAVLPKPLTLNNIYAVLNGLSPG